MHRLAYLQGLKLTNNKLNQQPPFLHKLIFQSFASLKFTLLCSKFYALLPKQVKSFFPIFFFLVFQNDEDAFSLSQAKQFSNKFRSGFDTGCQSRQPHTVSHGLMVGWLVGVETTQPVQLTGRRGRGV